MCEWTSYRRLISQRWMVPNRWARSLSGGIVTAEDFRRYKVKVTATLAVPLKRPDWTMHSLPPPSTAVICSFILRLLEGMDEWQPEVGHRSNVQIVDIDSLAVKIAWMIAADAAMEQVSSCVNPPETNCSWLRLCLSICIWIWYFWQFFKTLLSSMVHHDASCC